ncbi:MAG: PAS domain-containing protein [Bacteroidales bacterium]|nr:PAS domain-containing protein [Bacteroidales bacterium]
MKSNFSLRQRFTGILITMGVIIIAFMATAVNQLKKIKAYNDLAGQTLALADKQNPIDSLQNALFARLPYDATFFQTQRSAIAEKIKSQINTFQSEISSIGNSFYLNHNKQIRLKTFEINQLLLKYKQSLDHYLELVSQKGFGAYGVNGQINIIAEKLKKLSQEERNQNLARRIDEIMALKDQYLLNREITTLNKIKVMLQEVETEAILTIKNNKISFLADLQKFHQLILSLYEYDRNIGITASDGIMGKMKDNLSTLSLSVNELRNLINADLRKAVLWGYIWLSLFFLMVLIYLGILYFNINKYVHRPLAILSDFLSQMVRGKLPEKLEFKRNDEIAQMAGYLNRLVDGLKEKARFATDIGHNKLSSHFQPLSEDDILGNALIDMQKSLQKAEMEDAKYKNEEKKRIWTNEGLARFGEILRMHNNDLNMLADQIIQNLVKYLQAIQGALYFINDDDKDNIYLELYSAYAYDRKKYIKQQIPIGEGLIGTAVLEKEKIFITDIPEGYLTITSGLGDAPPACILIVPLKTEDTVLGVVELASFKLIEPHEIEFVEKIGATIASTITSVKINLQTARLLEKSQRQAEEMAEQEEEMRQNMEELRTTQEDFTRREAELQGFLNAIHLSSMIMILDPTGKILEVNNKIASFLQSKPDDLIGRYIFEFVNTPKETVDLLWEQLPLGKIRTLDSNIRVANNAELKVRLIFAPVFDKSANMIKVLLQFVDFTEKAEVEKMLQLRDSENLRIQQQLNQYISLVDTAFMRCEFSPDGKYIAVNQGYCQTVGLLSQELIGKDYTEYLRPDEKEQFEIIWKELLKGKPYAGVVKRTRPTGDAVWIMASMVPLLNDKNQLEKIILLAQDVTERKLKYQLLEEANKEIERLKKERKSEK